MLVFWFRYFGNGQICLLFWKCNHICDKIYLDFWVNPKCYIVAYVVVKRLHDELFVCCMTFAYLFNKCSTFFNFLNNCTMSLGNDFADGIFKSYIVQCDSSVEVYILTKIQWLLFMKICRRDFFMILFIIPMIA